MNNCQTCKHRKHGVFMKYKTRLQLKKVDGTEIVFTKVYEVKK